MSFSLNAFLAFLVRTGLHLYFLIVLGRFLFQYFKIDFYNPISQFILKATNPILIPMQKFIPRYARVDIASLLLLFVLKGLEYSLMMLLTKNFMPHMIGAMVWSLGEILSHSINIFFMAIIMTSILSWLPLRGHTPITVILMQLTKPLLKPAKKLLPLSIPIDLSPILVLLALQLINILVAQRIIYYGYQLS